jgi:ABC-type multidrug transport system fused ATPase/permease subunit
METEREASRICESLLFPKIFQTFRMAIQPSKLIIGFLAVAVICLAGWFMDLNKTVVADAEGRTDLHVYASEPHSHEKFIEKNKANKDEYAGVFSTLWQFEAARFHGVVNSLVQLNLSGVRTNLTECYRGVCWAFSCHPIYCIIFGLIKLAVISVAGGAICRIAALQFARGEKPGIGESLRFSTNKSLSFFGAPLAPIVIIIVIGVFIYLLGLVGSLRWAGELMIGLFTVLALLAGALIAVVIIGAVGGFNLMFPAVAYDGSDCFDAISRSFSYVYSKPWRMLFYTAIAAVYGAICYVFVRFFGFLLVAVPHRVLQMGILYDSKLTRIWPKPEYLNLLGSQAEASANWTESFAAFLVHLVLLAVIGLLVSFVISFYFSANTVIYSLMRNRVDNTALEEIYALTDEDEIEAATAEVEAKESEPASETKND